MSKLKFQGPILAALDGLEPRALTAALASEIVKVDRLHGDDAFAFTRWTYAVHEAAHGVYAAAAGIPIRHIEIYRKSQPTNMSSGGVLFDGQMGRITVKENHIVTADSNPAADLRWARCVISGRTGNLLSPTRRYGAALDELVRGRAIVRVVAIKLDTDPVQLFQDNEAFVRRILRCNWGIVLELARKLDDDGVAYKTKWRRELLDQVRRIEGGAPA